MPQLLKTANDETLDNFVGLFFDEMSAARALSSDACVQIMNGKLDISKTLPPNIAKEDQRVMLLALNSAPRAKSNSVSSGEFRRAMRSVMNTMPEKYVRVMAKQAAYAKRPDLVCDASIAFFKAILALPENQRHVALRGMYQGMD